MMQPAAQASTALQGWGATAFQQDISRCAHAMRDGFAVYRPGALPHHHICTPPHEKLRPILACEAE